MSEWKECKLGDITNKIGSGATPNGGENSYKTSGITLIRSQNVNDHSFESNGLAFIDEHQANLLKNVIIQKEDILINITGESVTRCCIAPKEYLPARVNQHVSIIRPRREIADYKYIYYYLHSIKPELNSMAEIGCTRRALTKEMLEQITIPLPPLPEQRAIAGVLSSLDDKIDLLHRQNKTLEGMAEAIYRHYFVEHRDSSWQECRVIDIANHIKNGINPMQNPNSLYYHYSIPAFDESHNPIRELGGQIQSNKYKVIKSTILFSKLNPHKDKRIWLVPDEIPENSVCSTEFQVIGPKNDKYLFFLFGFLNNPENYNEIAAGVGGTSGSHQRIDPATIFGLKSFIPDNSTIAEFNYTTIPIFNKINLNRKSVISLNHLRDTLIPKLMSGEVRVKL